MEDVYNLSSEMNQMDELLTSLRSDASFEANSLPNFQSKKLSRTPNKSAGQNRVASKLATTTPSARYSFVKQSGPNIASKPHNVEMSILSVVAEDNDYYYEEIEINQRNHVSSFSKASRFLQDKEFPISEGSIAHSNLVISCAADKKRKSNSKHTFGTGKRIFDSAVPRPTNDAMKIITTSKVDFLSEHSNPQNIVFHHDETARRKSSAVAIEDHGVRGPGYYTVDDNALNKITSKHKGNVPVGVIYRSPSVPKYRNGSTTESNHVREELIGPGTYNVDDSYRYVKPSPRTSLVYRAESKKTPQLQKKQYWEQKTADLRDIHDGMKLASDEIFHARTPKANFAPKLHMDDDKISKLAVLKSSESIDFGQPPLQYDVNYEFVERRSSVGVSMASEVAARESTKRKMTSKPGLVKAMADKEFNALGNQQFYGPQLPVPWAEDREVAIELILIRVDGEFTILVGYEQLESEAVWTVRSRRWRGKPNWRSITNSG